MPIKFPSIPEPGNDPSSQLNTLRAIKQVVDLLAANATGDKNPSGPSVGAQVFALQDEVKQLMKNQTAALTGAIDESKEDVTWTVDQAVSSLNQDISDARNKAIAARSDALTALDNFQADVAQTVWEFSSNLADASASIIEEAGARATADDSQAGRITKAAAYMGLNEATWQAGDLACGLPVARPTPNTSPEAALTRALLHSASPLARQAISAPDTKSSAPPAATGTNHSRSATPSSSCGNPSRRNPEPWLATAVSIPPTKKATVAASDRADSLLVPIMPCPDVHPLPIRVPQPTRKPDPAYPPSEDSPNDAILQRTRRGDPMDPEAW
jgi:hypothetical protein